MNTHDDHPTPEQCPQCVWVRKQIAEREEIQRLQAYRAQFGHPWA